VDYEALGWCLSIFCWLFFTGIGIPPCPEEAGILYAASVTATCPSVRWWLAWPSASLGVLCADGVLYGVGRLWGPRLFEYRWVQRLLKPERRERFEKEFTRHGVKLLVTARFLPPLRTGVFLLAGALRFSFLHFLIADGVYAVFGVALFYFTGAGLVEMIRRTGHWVWYSLAAIAGLYLLYRYYRYLRTREIRGAAAPPMSILEVPAPEEPVKKIEERDSLDSRR